MVSAHTAVVASIVSEEPRVARSQIIRIMADQAVKANGDQAALLALLAKQVEVGARMTDAVLDRVAGRLGLSDHEKQQIIAQAGAELRTRL